jgi:hypothetical protein
MPGAMRLPARFPNLLEVRRDLDAIADGLSAALAEGITQDAQPLLASTRALTPYGPGPTSEKDDLPHIRDAWGVSVQGGGIVLYSRHPGARVLEYGGTIRPRGVAITFRPEAMARRAAVRALPEIERNVEHRLAELAERHHF